MDYNSRRLIPYIPPQEYDKVARAFLEEYFSDALAKPMPIPIEEIARNGLGLDLRFDECLSEELDIYGMTIFTDGVVEVYDPKEGLYDTKAFKAKTVLIDPEAVKKTNTGCRNNTIAHEEEIWEEVNFQIEKDLGFVPYYDIN